MSDASIGSPFSVVDKPGTEQKLRRATPAIFGVILAGGLLNAILNLHGDIAAVGSSTVATGAIVMLGLALLIALGFEFVNGFHDTANAVATVIYTRSLPPLVAVIWSGFFNFLGVITSSGLVAYAIVSLLPVELILQAGSSAGYAMIFALLIAAIIWNLGTWAFGIPNSSSHALIGSILGVGLANQLMAPAGAATSGVQWDQAIKVIKSLLFSPIVGFALSALLLLVLRAVLGRASGLFKAPEGNKPPPPLTRFLLVLTCTGVSFFHGSNDGQKGLGLIMLILIGAAPTAYALNRSMSDSQTPHFVQAANAAAGTFGTHAKGAPDVAPDAARKTLTDALAKKSLGGPDIAAAEAALARDIAHQVSSYGSIKRVPASAVSNMRNDMYLENEAIRLGPKEGASYSGGDAASLKSFGGMLTAATRYIPVWVKISVALALGLGTMVGWKRIVVTVGEKIGKTHLTYAQGASAELVAMGTIGLAAQYGLPVSTTHILSSGVAGTMVANGSGLQKSTIINICLAWVLTLPAAILLSGGLFWLFRHVF